MRRNKAKTLLEGFLGWESSHERLAVDSDIQLHVSTSQYFYFDLLDPGVSGMG